MSTLNVEHLKHENSSGNNVTLDSDGSVAIDTSTLYVDAVNNRVGINTSTPTSPLDVTGNIFAKAFEFKASSDALTHGVTIHSSVSNALQINTNSVERLRVDGSGYVTMPYQPAFFAIRPGAHAVDTGGQLLAFDTAITNVGGHFNTSTSRFTAPVSGIYQFDFFALFRNSSDDNRSIEIALYKNGVAITGRGNVYGGNMSPGTGNLHFTVSATLILSVTSGDFFDVRVQASNTTNANFYYGDGLGGFTGRLIG